MMSHVSSATRTDAGPPTARTRGVAWVIASGRSRYLAISVLSVLFGIAVWWVLSLNGFRLPAPPAVVEKAGALWANGTLQSDILASLARVLAGFGLGVIVAIPVGFLMGWYRWARAVVEPWVQFFRTIPPLAMIPLAIVLLGIGEEPKVLVIFLASFFACVIAAYQGVVNVDRTLINAARVLGTKDFGIFVRVVIPASVPFILVGMRIGLGASWATVVAAELIAAQGGLGARMQQAQVYYDLDTIFVGLIAIGVLGLVMDRLLLAVETFLTRWQERR